jgi:hypothetical protein
VVTGLMPLAHAHSFALALALGAALALLFPAGRAWARFFAAAAAMALPQLLWSARGTALKSGSFLGWHLGWDRGDVHPVWFWLYNTGAFIPVLLVMLLAHRRLLPRPLLRYYLPFTLCFVVPNLLRLSPWIWDNIKFLFYWWVGSAPLVALGLARLATWRRAGGVPAAVLLVVLTLAGALDVWRITSGRLAHVIFDPEAVAFGRAIGASTPHGAVIAARPAYDSPALLSGRPAVLGYTGHIWSQGLDAGQRERDLDSFFAGSLDATALRQRYGATHVVVPAADLTSKYSESVVNDHAPVVVQTTRHALIAIR